MVTCFSHIKQSRYVLDADYAIHSGIYSNPPPGRVAFLSYLCTLRSPSWFCCLPLLLSLNMMSRIFDHMLSEVHCDEAEGLDDLDLVN